MYTLSCKQQRLRRWIINGDFGKYPLVSAGLRDLNPGPSDPVDLCCLWVASFWHPRSGAFKLEDLVEVVDKLLGWSTKLSQGHQERVGIHCFANSSALPGSPSNKLLLIFFQHAIGGKAAKCLHS